MPVIVRERQIVHVGAPGLQGPPGPAGGGAYWRHDQTTPAATWTLNHNLGRRVSVQVWSVGSRQLLAEVVHASDNQTLVYFDQPTAGYAIVT